MAEEIWSDQVDKGLTAGGYESFYLFQIDGEKPLYGYHKQGGDGGSETYSHFVFMGAESILTNMPVCTQIDDYETVDGSYQKVRSYTTDSGTANEAEYNAVVADLQSRTTSVLMQSSSWTVDFAQAFTVQNGSTAMTPDEALIYLQMQILVQ